MNTKLSKNAYGVQSSFDKEKVVAHQIMADNYFPYMHGSAWWPLMKAAPENLVLSTGLMCQRCISREATSLTKLVSFILKMQGPLAPA